MKYQCYFSRNKITNSSKYNIPESSCSLFNQKGFLPKSNYKVTIQDSQRWIVKDQHKCIHEYYWYSQASMISITSWIINSDNCKNLVTLKYILRTKLQVSKYGGRKALCSNSTWFFKFIFEKSLNIHDK